jgi:predicted nucleic acid-binding protein
MATVSKRLVIDASVASAAGLTTKPDSRRCREFLQEVLHISHRATMTPLLRAEWNRHQSRFAAIWLAEMRSKRKVEEIADVPSEPLRKEAPQRRSVQKDLYLVEAALATDKIVASLDELARTELALTACTDVMWVNPVDEGGHVIYWLRNGAAWMEEWKLGHGQ